MTTEALNQRFVYIPKKAIVASLLFHGVLASMYWGAKALDELGIHLFSQPMDVPQLYQEFIQVDVVGLPDIPLKDQVNVDTRVPVVETPATAIEPTDTTTPAKDAMTIQEELAAEKLVKEKAEKKAAEAKRKAEELKAIEKVRAEAKREAALKALAKPKNGVEGRGKMAGNVLSSGTSASGMIGSAKDRYSGLVYKKIKENFSVYAWQKQKKDLVSVIHIEIFPNGRVREKLVVRASKDPLFDSAVLQAIDAAQPLPVPEDDALLSGGITVEFRPE